MALGDFLGEVFVGILWQGVMNFIGACTRFLFVRKPFHDLLKENDLNPFVGTLVIIILLFIYL